MKYSVVTSVYRDGYLVHDFCERLQVLFCSLLNVTEEKLSEYLEVLIVNDGSPDDSLDQTLAAKKGFDFLKVVDLSRNFGQHEALACGFRLASGRYVIRMNIDMQDPPSELPKLLSEIEGGEWDMVVGCYSQRSSPWFNRLTAYLYFEIFRLLTGHAIIQWTSPMRVMNRAFIDAYNALTEKSRFPQGLDRWLGFRQKYVEINHVPRQSGKSAYNFWSRSRLALTGILYFSDQPLKLIGYSGFMLSAVGILLGIGVILQKIMGVSFLPGYASLAAFGLFGFGLQIAFIGVLGLYVGRIFREVQNRPLYVVRKIYE